jgi:2-hydroxy-4-carboxymuconate semialdehyde hemiacetal dehydrogenase
MHSSVGICLIGYGMMGEWHAKALATAECTLHTLVGRRPEPTQSFAHAHGFRKWTLNLDEALADPAIDAVLVAGPSQSHAEMALTSLRAGKHVLVEIPIALDLADARAVVEEAKARGLKLGVVHPMRFRREHLALIDRLSAGEEHVRHLEARLFLHRFENVGSTGYRRSWTDNLLWHHGAHLIDVSLWLTGAGHPEEAEGRLSRLAGFISRPDQRTGIPMDMGIQFAVASEQLVVCTGSYSSPERIFDVFVITDRNSYRVDIFRGRMTTDAGDAPIESEEENNAHVARDFVDAVRRDRAPRVSGSSVLPAMRVLHEVERGQS